MVSAAGEVITSIADQGAGEFEAVQKRRLRLIKKTMSLIELWSAFRERGRSYHPHSVTELAQRSCR